MRLCVNPAHLRIVTRKQNAENRSGAASNSASGVRGVFWHKQNRKWTARASVGRKIHYGGSFDTIEEAEVAAIALRNRLFTHNAKDRALL